MKKKMTTLLFAFAIGATSAFAQEIAAADRFGHGQDSIECLQNISMYSEHVKAKNYAEAYGPWKAVFYKHPAARIAVCRTLRLRYRRVAYGQVGHLVAECVLSN